MTTLTNQPAAVTRPACPDAKSPFLRAISALAEAPLTHIAEQLRNVLIPYVSNSALVIFTEDCTGRPQKKAGEEGIITRVSIADLEKLRSSLSDDEPWLGEAELADDIRSVMAIRYAPSRALLVITDPDPAAVAVESALDLIEYLWHIAARRIQEKVADAPPSYLMESRAASAERVRVTAELVDMHSTTLETLLAALRSPSLDDASARSTVTDMTAKALVALRTVSDRTTDLVEEPVAQAFVRLQEDLRPLTRFSGIEVQFIEPPLNGRALPGEVAHAARAVVRGLVLAMMEQPEVRRIRAQWDCDGDNLLINIRDDGNGALSADASTMGRLDRRVQALAGTMQMDVMTGWGADVSVTLPLDAPIGPKGDITGWNLAPRELEILQHLAAGHRNRTIATALTISENTVKFHVRNVFKKLGVRSRTEAIAAAHSHGMR
ncbi:helix-turn-helix transcriptional regulator [Arthrobacter sp. NPDC093128]|uniref:helix-turn-helix transcriptional regulator n=1 Tax=Arthrobacter sp. NPDC093128 TaxID=3154979 RepID=UPI00341403CC